MMPEAKIVKAWVEKVVIAHNFCPFARKEFDDDSIRYAVYEGTDIEEAMHSLLSEVERLEKDESITTTLFIFSNMLKSFDAFLDVVELANALLVEQGYEGVYQLASFHPDYFFADEESEASSYTNRAPFPVLHIINEADVEAARKYYPDIESVPEKNIALALSKGKAYFEKILKECRDENQ